MVVIHVRGQWCYIYIYIYVYIYIYIYTYIHIYIYIHIYTHTRTVAAKHEVASAMRHSVNPATPHTDAHSLAAAASAACVCVRDVGLD